MLANERPAAQERIVIEADLRPEQDLVELDHLRVAHALEQEVIVQDRNVLGEDPLSF